MDVTKSHCLDNIVELSKAQLKAKKVDYASLPAQRSKVTTTMEKEMEDLKEGIVDVNKKRFSLFK